MCVCVCVFRMCAVVHDKYVSIKSAFAEQCWNSNNNND